MAILAYGNGKRMGCLEILSKLYKKQIERRTETMKTTIHIAPSKQPGGNTRRRLSAFLTSGALVRRAPFHLCKPTRRHPFRSIINPTVGGSDLPKYKSSCVSHRRAHPSSCHRVDSLSVGGTRRRSAFSTFSFLILTLIVATSATVGASDTSPSTRWLSLGLGAAATAVPVAASDLYGKTAAVSPLLRVSVSGAGVSRTGVLSRLVVSGTYTGYRLKVS